jgi:methylglyoxal/glyoxal reductase
MESIKDCVQLNNGLMMPRLGFGLFRVDPGETEAALAIAIEAGYRSLDTAAFYENEAETGRAVKKSGIPREEFFITTKLWNSEQGYDKTMRAFDVSMKKLDMDYVDLYLIHWPGLNDKRRHETWKAFTEIYKSGRAKSIGVSNFNIHHIDKLIDVSDIMPVVNQVELHPWYSHQPLREYCADKDIVVEAWGPLFHAHLSEEPRVLPIAKKHGKTAAQVVLRWHWQNGVVAIPKSVHRERIYENAAIFDFALDDADMAAIDDLNKDKRFGPDPDSMTFGFAD